MDKSLLESEKKIANTILKQMGLHDVERYEEEINIDLNNEYEEHKEVYDEANVIAKPEFIKRREIETEEARKGNEIDGSRIKPLANMIVFKMDEDRETKRESGIILADLRPVKCDSPIGEVVKLNDNTKYDFKVGDRVVIDLRYIRHRYRYQGATYLILNKDGVMGIYE